VVKIVEGRLLAQKRRIGINDTPNSHGAVLQRGIWLGAGLLVIAALTFGSLTQSVDSKRSTAFELQVTATPAIQPGPTFTPIPGLPVPPSGPAFRAFQVLQGLVLALVCFGAVFIAFTRPGAWNHKNILDVSIGLLGWFILNTLLWSWVMGNESGFINPTRIVPLLVNIIAMIGLARVRRWMLLGIVCAILVNAAGLLFFPAPTNDIVHTDPTLKRIILMAPFYLPFFFPLL
jgi:hypothetical protein